MQSMTITTLVDGENEVITSINGISVGDRVWYEDDKDPETARIRYVTGFSRLESGQYYFHLSNAERIEASRAHRISEEYLS